MTKVTKESLAKRIAELESGPRSLKEDFYLAAMKELYPSVVVRQKQEKCKHRWTTDSGSEGRTQTCYKCWAKRSFC